MDYRMYNGETNPIPAGENVVTLIKESLKLQGITVNCPLKFIGFEGPVATEFYLNGHEEPMEIPSSGSFVTPFTGDRYMPVYSLVFAQSFEGKIYYIL